MAFKIAPFYNVQNSVGRGVGGSGSDVMLVQYMLFHVCIQPNPHFSNNRGEWTPVAPAGAGPGAIFPFDGIYRPELDDWIAVFQGAANRRGMGQLTIDGRINRAPVGWGKRSKQRAGRWFTIQALNELMWRFSEKPYSDLPNLSDIPGQLKTDLTRFDIPDFD
jgi:hypothetical protein